MKKIYILAITFLFLIGCGETSNDSSPNSVSGDGQGGSLATFTLKGKYLYTVDFYNLSVFNIENTQNPIKVNTIDVGFDIETLFSFKDYLFIGSRDAMYIYDISNAELPKKLSQSNHFRSCDPVVANATHAYVTLHTNTRCEGTVNELKVYDIADVENPKLLNTRGLTQPKGLALYGDDYLLVCDEDVKIFNISNPENSVFIKSIPTNGSIDIIIRENHAFIINEHSIDQYELNYNNIEQFTKISSFTF